MPESDVRRSWTQVRRFEFLEWKMFWEDRVIRSDLEQTFGISTPQASVDLRNYREVAPDNLETTARGYRPGPHFQFRFLTPSADRLLLQLRAYLASVIPRHDLWFRDLPPVDIAPDISRSVEPECLRQILRAIRNRETLEVDYQSLSKAERRRIAPHALAFDGHRWHARSWCCSRQEFRDFVLSRLGALQTSSAVDYDPVDDLEWETRVTLVLKPHSGLSNDAKRAIERDYGMTSGRLPLEMRASLAFYFIRRMNLDLDVTDKVTAQRLQVELENRDEVSAAIEAAKAESKVRTARRTLQAQGDAQAPGAPV